MGVTSESRAGRAGRASKRRRRHFYGPVLYDSAERDARVLLRAIKGNLGQVTFFQREDLMRVAESLFGDVSTISRYNRVRNAVNFLVTENGELVKPSRTDLALPGKARNYSDTPLHMEYLDTIRNLVSAMPKGEPFRVQDIMLRWKSDSHLSENSKRIAIRHAMTPLVKEKVCKRRDDYSYSV